MRRAWYLGLAAAVVLALFGYSLVDVGPLARKPGEASEVPPPPSIPMAHRADPPTVSNDASAPVARLSQEVASLRREVADLKHTLAGLGEAAGRAPADEGDAGETQAEESSRVEDMLAEEARIRREALTTQDNAFRQEGVDPHWSAATLAVMESGLADMSISENVRALECRAATCRVEIAKAIAGKSCTGSRRIFVGLQGVPAGA